MLFLLHVVKLKGTTTRVNFETILICNTLQGHGGVLSAISQGVTPALIKLESIATLIQGSQSQSHNPIFEERSQ